MRATVELPAITYAVPQSLAEITRQGASAVGNSAVGAWLGCPQFSYLQSQGVERKQDEDVHVEYGLSALAFGSLFHALRAVRLVHGHAAAEDVLTGLASRRELNAEDSQKALLLLRVYDDTYPLQTEPFQVLGVEVEVITNIRDWWGRPLYRTVRYDTVIRLDGAIFSLECKTMAKAGVSSINPYVPQGMVHSAIWNSNEALVAKYGAMQGTIWDCAIKTTTPRAERIGPRYFSTTQQQLALDYLRLPDAIQMPRMPDGSYPKFLHTCWGRWSPCKYIGLCHDGTYGDYQRVDRATGEVLPYFP